MVGKMYPEIESLLLYFVVYGIDGHAQIEQLDDLKVIKKYVSDSSHAALTNLMVQWNKMICADQFPEEWIGNIMSHACPTTKIVTWRQWMQWLIDTLRFEAKKAGKL